MMELELRNWASSLAKDKMGAVLSHGEGAGPIAVLPGFF